MFELNSRVREKALQEVDAWMRAQGLVPDRAFATERLDEALRQAQEHLDAGLPLRTGGTGDPRIDAMLAEVRGVVGKVADSVHTQLARGALVRIGLSDETINQII